MNNRQTGDLSELIALTRFIEAGYDVAIPYGNSKDYDLLVRHPECLDRSWRMVQVKTATRRGNRGNRIYVDTIRGSSLSKRRGYSEGAFDFLVGVLPDERKMWCLPFGVIVNRRCVTISEDTLEGIDVPR